MSTDIVAADQLKAIVQRVERLEAEIADLNADKSEIYKEARANGFDVKVIKKVVSKRKIDQHEREEQDHVFDLYWDAVHGLNLVHAHARENIQQFDANPRLIKQVVDGVQTEAGRAALAEETHERPSTNDEPSPEVGPQAEASPAGTGAGTLADREGRSNGEAVPADLPTHFGKATVATQGEATEPTSDDGADHAAAANAGGDDVDGGALRANRDEKGEGAASTLPSKPKHRLRPNCLDRSNCKSGSVDHCWSCKKAMAEKSGVAA